MPVLSAFLMKNFFMNWLKSHMQISDDDSNIFCKFDEISKTLRQCGNFIICQMAENF